MNFVALDEFTPFEVVLVCNLVRFVLFGHDGNQQVGSDNDGPLLAKNTNPIIVAEPKTR